MRPHLFGRLLSDVYVDGVMVNELLVREGYAQVSTFPPDVKYVDRFLAAQQDARSANRGLWGGCQEPRQLRPSQPAVRPPPLLRGRDRQGPRGLHSKRDRRLRLLAGFGKRAELCDWASDGCWLRRVRTRYERP